MAIVNHTCTDRSVHFYVDSFLLAPFALSEFLILISSISKERACTLFALSFALLPFSKLNLALIDRLAER